MRKILLLVGCLLMLRFLPLESQDLNIQLEPCFTTDGLASNMVYSMTEDQEGYLWIGTANGLNRFDGSVFVRMYGPEQGTEEGMGLSGQVIKALLTDREGNIWVGTQGGGLTRIDYVNQTTRFFQYDGADPNSLLHNEILSLLEDPEGNIWVGTEKGLSILDIKRGKFYNHIAGRGDASSLYSSAVLSLTQDKDGNILFGTWAGLAHKALRKDYTKDLANFPIKRLPHKDMDANLPYDEGIWGLTEDSKGRIWGGTFGKGVIVMNPDEGEEWLRFSPKQQRSFGLRVFDLWEDRQNRIWIATGEGLNIVEMPEDASLSLREQMDQAIVHRYRHLPGQNFGFPSNQARRFFQSRNGILWVAFEGGLAKYDEQIAQFESFLYDKEGKNPLGIGAICKDTLGQIWVGTWGQGVFRFDSQTGKLRQFKHNARQPGTIFKGRVRAMMEWEGEIWIGTANGLSILNPQTLKIRNYALPNPENQHVTSIYDFAVDSAGYVFVASYEGLIRIDPEDMSYGYFRLNAKDPYALPGLELNELAFDERGNLWIGTESDGLIEARFFPDGTIRCQRYFSVPGDPHSLRNKDYLSLAIDQEKIWVGTPQGLQCMDRSTHEFEVIGMEAGLPTLNAQGVHVDAHGYIWVSTNPGIARYNRSLKHFTVYGETHGLKSSNHFNGGTFVDKDGTHFYGGNNGFTRFHPDHILTDFASPRVTLNALSFGNEEVRVGVEDSYLGVPILAKPLSRTEAITLSYQHKVVRIDFAVLNFRFADQGQVEYRLEGVEEHWNKGNFNRSAIYTNIPPGTYTFQVRAANHEGRWNEQYESLQITVKPPFWQLWYFRIITSVGILIALYGVYRYRVRRVKALNRRLQEKVDQRTEALAIAKEQETESRKAAEKANQIKSDFLANMSHEIRTPMNGVLGMAELLDDNTLRPDQKEYVDTILKSGESLLSIINDILDFSKIESGKLELAPVPFSILELVEEVLGLFGSHVSDRPIELLYEIDPRVPLEIEGDTLRLRQVLINLIGNATKFTEKGQILLKVEPENPKQGQIAVDEVFMLRFSVIDSGIGIPEEKQQSLFDAFTQVDASTTREYGGTGLGLAISSRLANLMGGTMGVKSKPGEGATFSFQMETAKKSRNAHRWVTDADLAMLEGIRVLLAEDHEMHALIMEKRLQNWGIETLTVQNGKEALELLKTEKVDLIFTDLYMPHMDGHELAETLARQGSQIPIVLFTALGSIKSMKDTGLFKGVMAKPLRQKAVLRTLVEALRQDPVEEPSIEPSSQAQQEPVASMPSQALRILLTEDNPVNQKLALRMLGKLGYEATVAKNGQVAIDKIQEANWDLVLMDIQMPVLDGLTATRRIRKEFPQEKQPLIIAMTANAMEGDREKCIDAGMDDYISKPFRLDDLRKLLQKYFAQELVS